MNRNIAVSRARVSYVATRVSANVIDALANPDNFEALLVTPEPVAGLELSLPYPDPTNSVSSDRTFWSNVTERPTLGQSCVEAAWAPQVRRSGLPLRHRPVVTPLSRHQPRLEIYCLGFGCVVVATLEVFCNPAVDLKSLAQALTTLDSTELNTTIGTEPVQAKFSALADRSADVVIGLLSAPSQRWSFAPYRIVSVIAGTGEAQLEDMPTDGGPVHRAMHALARGQGALPPAGDAFLPYWSGRSSFGWAPSELVYILDTGCAQLRQSAALERPLPPAWTTSDYHRLLTLARVHVAADICLLKAADEANSGRLQAWAKVAAYRLSRLYGPKPASYDFWGLACRSFITSYPDTAGRIEARRTDGNKLYGLPWPAYPKQAAPEP